LWQTNRCPVLKTKLNKAIKALKNLLETERNQGIQRYLSELSPSAETNYSLWKATKRLKRPQIQFSPIRKQDGRWARSDEEKAEVFAEHLSKVFESHPRKITIHEEKKLLTNTSAQMAVPVMPFTVNEVRAAIRVLNPKKAPGYDLITKFYKNYQKKI